MSERRGLIGNVAVTAEACVSGISRLFTGGCGYCRAVAVSFSRDNLLRYKNVSTDRALLTLGETYLGTGRRLSGNDLFIVVGAKVLAAYVTGVILIGIGVSLCSDHILLYGSLSAHGTYLTVSKTVLGACSRLAGYQSLGVTEGRLIIRYVAVSASGACVGSIACVCACGRGYRCAVAMLLLVKLFCIGVIAVVLTCIGLDTIFAASGLLGNYTAVPIVRVGVELAVWRAADCTYSMLGTCSLAAHTLVRCQALKVLCSLVYSSNVYVDGNLVSLGIHKERFHFTKLRLLDLKRCRALKLYGIHRLISLEQYLAVYCVNHACGTGDLKYRRIGRAGLVLEGYSDLFCSYATKRYNGRCGCGCYLNARRYGDPYAVCINLDLGIVTSRNGVAAVEGIDSHSVKGRCAVECDLERCICGSARESKSCALILVKYRSKRSCAGVYTCVA